MPSRRIQQRAQLRETLAFCTVSSSAAQPTTHTTNNHGAQLHNRLRSLILDDDVGPRATSTAKKEPLMSKDGTMSFDFEEEPDRRSKEGKHPLIVMSIDYLEEQGADCIRLLTEGEITHKLLTVRFNLLDSMTSMANDLELLKRLEKEAKDMKKDVKTHISDHFERNSMAFPIKLENGDWQFSTWRWFIERYTDDLIIDPREMSSDDGLEYSDSEDEKDDEDEEEEKPAEKPKKQTRAERELAALLEWQVK